MPPLTALRDEVCAHARNRPGVYRMLGARGEVLYVGRSVHVRARLLSYFRAPPGDKAADIIASAHALAWEYVPDAFAAQLREFRLIRRLRPPFNVEHTENGPFCFVQVTDEEAPRLLRADAPALDGEGYCGPFRGRARVDAALRELSNLLGLRDCAADTPMRLAACAAQVSRAARPLCLRADLQRCLAPCAGRCTRAAYLERVALARRFLAGDAREPLAQLEGRMREAAARLDFERAAALRDRALRLEALRAEMLALHGLGESLSLVYPVRGHGGAERLYLIRRGLVRAQLCAPRTERERAGLRRRAAALYGRGGAGERVSGREAGEVLLVARWFRQHPAEYARALPAARFLASGAGAWPSAPDVPAPRSAS